MPEHRATEPCQDPAGGDLITAPALSSAGKFHFSSHPKTFQGGEIELISRLLCFLREGEEGDAEPAQAQGDACPGKPTETRRIRRRRGEK